MPADQRIGDWTETDAAGETIYTTLELLLFYRHYMLACGVVEAATVAISTTDETLDSGKICQDVVTVQASQWKGYPPTGKVLLKFLLHIDVLTMVSGK